MKRIIGGLMVLSIVLGVGAYAIYRAATVTKTSTFRIVYKTMPADDAVITEWLRSQPEVTQASVSRDGDTLVLVFVTAPSSPEPEIVKTAERFGYRGWGGIATSIELSPLFPW